MKLRKNPLTMHIDVDSFLPASDEEKAEAKKKHDAAFALIPVPDGVENLSY